MRRALRALRGLVLLLAAPALGGCAALGHVERPAERVRGPLPIRSNHPLALNFLAFLPRRAAATPPGQDAFGAHVAYASIHEIDADGISLVSFDGEVGRAVARWRRGLARGWDVEVAVAGEWASGGFLDAFVEAFHSLFVLGNQGRELVRQGAFDMRLFHDGQLVYRHADEDFGWADLPVVFTRAVRAEDGSGPGLALRFGVELPTASESDGRGNGALDVGVGFLGERTRGRWTATGALDWVRTESPSSFDGSGAEVGDLFDLQAGVEYRWSDAVSLLGELVVLSPLVDAVELEEIDSPVLELGLGLAIDGPGGSLWRVAFQEDLLAAAGTDFTAFVGWTSGM